MKAKISIILLTVLETGQINGRRQKGQEGMADKILLIIGKGKERTKKEGEEIVMGFFVNSFYIFYAYFN